jgi:hypothetical protein
VATVEIDRLPGPFTDIAVYYTSVLRILPIWRPGKEIARADFSRSTRPFESRANSLRLGLSPSCIVSQDLPNAPGPDSGSACDCNQAIILCFWILQVPTFVAWCYDFGHGSLSVRGRIIPVTIGARACDRRDRDSMSGFSPFGHLGGLLWQPFRV